MRQRRQNNIVSDLEFGCEADGSGAGGIPDTGDTATLRTFHGDVTNQLTIQRAFTGVNTVGTDDGVDASRSARAAS